MKRLYQLVALSMVASSFTCLAQEPGQSQPKERMLPRELMALNTLKPVDNAAVDIPITGKVTDEKGEGLPGVSVVVKGSTQGATTDGTGSFKVPGIP
ncbi:MAG: hypothetical protein EOO39_18205, partial [Cytophagaceae bacterium]